MACMCGGCKSCLADQGYAEYPEFCPVCSAELLNEGPFCSPECEAKYIADQKAEADALVKELAEEAALAAEWKATRKVA